jgi:hypothetical protein
MDPITAAIVAAISAGAIGGLTEVSKTALTDAYGKLKALLVKKFGKESDVVQAVEQVEAKPTSQARMALLSEEVTEVQQSTPRRRSATISHKPTEAVAPRSILGCRLHPSIPNRY